ncbi:Protein dispatched -like protein 1 [Halotydeus destructor]|nr:Protein dispatched -like protein 1 [Halotydeus destructor]
MPFLRDLRNLLANKWPQIVSRHPVVMLSVTLLLTLTTLFIIAMNNSLPSFDDPLVGFEARGTEVAKKINTWKLITGNYRSTNEQLTIYPHNYQKRLEKIEKVKIPVNLETDEEEQEKLRLAAQLNQNRFKSNSSRQTICPFITEQHAHIVVKSITPNENLLSLEHMKSLCKLDDKLRLKDRDSILFSSVCESRTSTGCCLSWSLPNYIALLANKTSCHDITDHDVKSFRDLLQTCASAFHHKTLSNSCNEDAELCPKAPAKCFAKENIVYNVMHFLVQSNFIKNPKDTPIIEVTSIFLPIAKSSKLVDYYIYLTKNDLRADNLEVVAADLGIKNALFEHLLLQDTWLLLVALIVVLAILLVYSRSIIVVITCLISFVMSIGLTYVIYTQVYGIDYFPFMNMMTVVILVGVGVDNTLVSCSIWHSLQEKYEIDPVHLRLRETLKLTITSTFFTSLTTSSALLSSYMSSVSAIRIYASTAVMVNFCCSCLFLSSALVVNLRCSRSSSAKKTCSYLHHVNSELASILVFLIEKLKYLLFFSFLLFTLFFSFVIYHDVKLPSSQHIQTFKSSHPFESYDLIYRDKFAFNELVSEDDQSAFPISFVFGVRPSDTGSYVDPSDRGELVFDEQFDMSSKESQAWLLKFCKKVRNSTFYKPIAGPLLGNCFIETFKTWMEERPCFDNITDLSNYPCCNSSLFPYEPKVFRKCIGKAIELLHRTPTYVVSQYSPGPRFSKDTSNIRAAIVEYYTHFNYTPSYINMSVLMNNMTNWMNEALIDAPEGMKSAWFINSYLDLYALQDALLDGTQWAVPFALLAASSSLILSTRDLKLSSSALLTVLCIIICSVGLLVRSGWEINLVESITLTAAAGMAVDYPLHFIFAYKHINSRENPGSERTRKCLRTIGPPLLFAGMTTGVSGLTMVMSNTLAYAQVGVFLLTISAFNLVFVFLFLAVSIFPHVASSNSDVTQSPCS